MFSIFKKSQPINLVNNHVKISPPTTLSPTPSMPGFYQRIISNSPEEVVSYKFNFTDRTSYFEWREAWRSQYKTLAHLIRQSRARVVALYHKGQYENAAKEQSHLYRLRLCAHELMDVRTESKVYAAEQQALNKKEDERVKLKISI